LLPGLTAILATLVQRPATRLTHALWPGLIGAYTLTGFDQPFFLSQRLFGVGIVVPQHWLAWHLPTLGLLLTLACLTLLLLRDQAAVVGATLPGGVAYATPSSDSSSEHT
jgi:hypothetical protein